MPLLPSLCFTAAAAAAAALLPLISPSHLHSSLVSPDTSKNKFATLLHLGAPNGFSVLVNGVARFVGVHCSLVLKKRGDGVLEMDRVQTSAERASLLRREVASAI
ncbi:unnamed protein product [Fraxinus pennsylvanica]|uniref:Uncharacterized protein n=1 Tax=Fraxinus pennsylvanica TaxID=56036 RepID=A0AAD2A4S1_9LAMI|nr:unnamed protein product [Fraxinus pennsylvanica]